VPGYKGPWLVRVQVLEVSLGAGVPLWVRVEVLVVAVVRLV